MNAKSHFNTQARRARVVGRRQREHQKKVLITFCCCCCPRVYSFGAQEGGSLIVTDSEFTHTGVQLKVSDPGPDATTAKVRTPSFASRAVQRTL